VSNHEYSYSFHINKNGQQVGNMIICTPDNNDLEEEQRKYCDNLILKKAQKENPDLF
jgi:hypothetical protein